MDWPEAHLALVQMKGPSVTVTEGPCRYEDQTTVVASSGMSSQATR